MNASELLTKRRKADKRRQNRSILRILGQVQGLPVLLLARRPAYRQHDLYLG
jgi:hypothetical protein